MPKRGPNVLITGTPGCGKSSLCEAVLRQTPGYRHVCVGDVVRDKELHAGAGEHGALLIDEAAEDKIVDELEGVMGEGGVLLEHHSVDFFPERWFDLVLVLRTDNTVLFDRLTKRCGGAGALGGGCAHAAWALPLACTLTFLHLRACALSPTPPPPPFRAAATRPQR